MKDTPPSSPPDGLIQVGDLVINRQRHLVTIAGRLVDLSPTEFYILAYLAQKSPQVVSASELMHGLYGHKVETHPESAVIRNNIYRIRSKLGEVSSQNSFIRTVRGIGYSLQNPQETEEADEMMIDGRYHLQQLIGQGATARVYKAYQESLDRHVAIKILRSSLLDEESFQERFRLEARLVGGLQHPNIVQVYDFGKHEGNYYIVMELIEGQTLDSLLKELEEREQKQPLPQVMKIVRETGLALAYAHRREMIHRDIKPGNIMLTEDGRTMLMDFGLAKLVDAPHLTVEGKISGTPYYMSPEQIQGLPLDTRVDIYALGVVMYQMLTGRLPFTAENEMAVLFQHIRDIPSLPTHFVPELSRGTEFITLKALAKRPGDRYQTMEAMLADLDDPENVAGQLTEILPSLKASTIPPHHLPSPPTPFIGRKEELETAQSRLVQAGTRLLTLVGIGGVGKTRLVLEVGRTLLHTFPDGVFFLDLTAIQRPALLPGMIAHLVHMAEEGEEALREQLLAYLSKRHLLLILDNFEHLLDAASLISMILVAAPRCKILVTSREPLRLYGENLLQVSPLPSPDLRQQLTFEELSLFTAVQLFADRAQAVDAEFSLTADNIQAVAEICVQLDGLPLALELAANQIYTFSLPELVVHLNNRLSMLTEGPRDRSARQQTMKGTIEWSYSLLNKTEQQAFNNLSIFSGRFSTDAAFEVVGPVSLQTLAQKGLLQYENAPDGKLRFWMLQVINEYAYANLKASDAFETLEQKHTAFYRELAESAEPHLTGINQKDWFALLDVEHDNFRAILHRTLEENDPETALQFGSILWRLWAVYSYLSEGVLWLESILNVTAAFRNKSRAKLLYGAGRIALFQQKLALAGRRFNESLDLYRELNDQTGQAILLNSLGEIALMEDDQEQAGQLFHNALALFQAAEDKIGIAQSLTHLGQLAFMQGEYEKANDFLLQSLDMGEGTATLESTAIKLNGLGEIARMQKRYDEAATFYERSLALYRQLNYGMGQAAILHNLGQVKLAQEQFQEAAATFRQSLGLLRTMEEKVFIGWNLAGLGAALLNLGNAKHAVRLFSATQALFQRFGGQLDAPDQAVYKHYLAVSQKMLPEPEWHQAWLEGQAMPVENELLNVIALTPMFPQNEETS